MEIRNVESWHRFLEEVEHLNEIRSDFASGSVASVSRILYRGQANSSWPLRTTLERFVREDIPVMRYYDFVHVIKAKIEALTGRRWEIPSREEFAGWCERQTLWPFDSFPGYEYLAYLRHHGFPSPLLDWTRSPYIGAYFAMADTPEKGIEKVAVFAYLEYASGIKTGDIAGAIIQSLGSYVAAHRRHYLQQDTYTICTKGEGSSLSYANHEDVTSQSTEGQDLLWRMDIPAGQRQDFLSRLEVMNINAFSLFETEEKLMEHIYTSEVLLANHL
jgi:hypothetical protein